MPYAELHTHSAYSFLDGASTPEELVEEAARLDLRAIALTDHDGLYGVVRFAEAAKAAGGVDVVLDMVGGDYFAGNLDALKIDGRIVYIAAQAGGDIVVRIAPGDGHDLVENVVAHVAGDAGLGVGERRQGERDEQLAG